MGEFGGIWLVDVVWGRAIGKLAQGLTLILQHRDDKAHFYRVTVQMDIYWTNQRFISRYPLLAVIQRVFHNIPSTNDTETNCGIYWATLQKVNLKYFQISMGNS